MVEIIISNEQDKIEFTKELENAVKSVCEAVLSEEECDFDAEISLTLTDDESIREINREHRGIDKPTDVLSFPMLEFDGDCYDVEEEPDSGLVVLGDIVISMERAAAQAEEYGHGLKREVAFLTAHSMLHLLGYDHVDDEEGERVMREKQDKILNGLNITRG